jgi:hypothetical protein
LTGPIYRLPDNTDKALRRFISENNNGEFKKGMIMNELVKAVEYWIATKKVRNNTHTLTHDSGLKVGSNVPPKVLTFRDKMVAYLENSIGYEELSLEPRVVTFKHFKQAIAAVRGTDDRTFDKGRKELIDNSLIREYNHGVEFVVEGKTLPSVKGPKQTKIDGEVSDVFKKLGI